MFDNGTYGQYPAWNSPYRVPNGMFGVPFVNGEEEARRLQTSAGDTLIMDRLADVFYIKHKDEYGNSTLDAYDFTKREPAVTQYVTAGEFNKLKEQYEFLAKQLAQQPANSAQPITDA